MAEPIGSLPDFPVGVPRRVKLSNGEPVLVYNANTSTPGTGGGCEAKHSLVAIGDAGGQMVVRLDHPDSEQLFVVQLRADG